MTGTIEARGAAPSEMEHSSCDVLYWAELWELYYDPILRYIYSCFGDRQFAEDCTQQAFLQAMESALNPSFNQEKIEQPKAWLYRIAHNVMVSQARKFQYVIPLDSLPPLPQEYTGEDSFDSVDCFSPYVLGEISELPEKQQETLRLRFVYGLGPNEIAEILGVKPSAVKSRQFRATCRLRGMI